jgi:hypothetical protein
MVLAHNMDRKMLAFIALLAVSLSVFALPQFVKGTLVFSDNFSSGNFANWSEAYASPGSSQAVNGGVAHFTVPTPPSGYDTYSYVVKDGFASTPNSTLAASEDIYVSKVPNGCVLSNGAIFFFYLCDSNDLSGNTGNFGVGIDGSDLWSLWIGGNPAYNYVFQTAGASPSNNTWYHLVLTVDNPDQTVTLAVNGSIVVAAAQQQFTDKNHAISLVSGMGEDWWSQGSGQQEIDIANVRLDISDAPQPAPTATSQPPTPTSNPQNPLVSSTQTITTEPAPLDTPKPTPAPTPKPSAVPSTQTTLTAEVQDGQKISLYLNGSIYNPKISNLTVTPDKSMLSFTLNGQGNNCFGNLTVPKTAVKGIMPVLYVDGQFAADKGYSQNAESYYIWGNLTVGTRIEIVFEPQNSTSEPFPVWVLLTVVLVAIVCLGVVLVIRKKR